MITVGISYSIHDSAACIAENGKLIYGVAEERITRLKHDGRFPIHSIKACLDHAGVTLTQVDSLVVGWPHPVRSFIEQIPMHLAGVYGWKIRPFITALDGVIPRIRNRGGLSQLRHLDSSATLSFMSHHYAHAISAYAYSGFEDAAVVVVDGRGSTEATTIWHGQNGKLKLKLTLGWPDSLGLVYASFTHHLGFEAYSDEWKVMGLAPYGSPGVDISKYIDVSGELYRVAGKKLLQHGMDSLALTGEFGPRRVPESEIRQQDKDLAFAVQATCEAAMVNLVKYAKKVTCSKNLCLAGGVALNSKANGTIKSLGIFEGMFVQPAAADEGACLGAVLEPYLRRGLPIPHVEMRHCYWGDSYDDDAIEALLKTYKLSYRKSNNIGRDAAQLLANGMVMGWFQGRMEFGPRALGARSIIADVRDPQMKDRVNDAVKFRENWRPFAPAVLKDRAGEFFENCDDSPFMILTFPVKESKKNVIPATTHVDGSARVQTVEKELSPDYWELINAFGEITGVPVIMNTSFNLRDEPIVRTPRDAIRTFFTSGLDALALNSFLITK